jgi:hypothetical protein
MSSGVSSNITNWLNSIHRDLCPSPRPTHQPKQNIQSIYYIYNILIIVVTCTVDWLSIWGSVAKDHKPVKWHWPESVPEPRSYTETRTKSRVNILHLQHILTCSYPGQVLAKCLVPCWAMLGTGWMELIRIHAHPPDPHSNWNNIYSQYTPFLTHLQL